MVRVIGKSSLGFGFLHIRSPGVTAPLKAISVLGMKNAYKLRLKPLKLAMHLSIGCFVVFLELSKLKWILCISQVPLLWMVLTKLGHVVCWMSLWARCRHADGPDPGCKHPPFFARSIEQSLAVLEELQTHSQALLPLRPVPAAACFFKKPAQKAFWLWEGQKNQQKLNCLCKDSTNSASVHEGENLFIFRASMEH